MPGYCMSHFEQLTMSMLLSDGTQSFLDSYNDNPSVAILSDYWKHLIKMTVYCDSGGIVLSHDIVIHQLG